MLHWSRMLGAEQPSAARSFEIPPPWDNTPLVRRHEKYYFTDGTIVVKIDGVSFHLHRGTLERYSPKFKIPGVNVRDFERFLSVLYPDELGVEPVRSPEEWISLLKQSHHWQVESLKRVASQHVASLDMSPAERIKLYQDCGLGDSIDLLAAFTQLCQREEAISLLEANLLGMEAYSKVVALREMIIKHQVTGHLTDEVARTFALRGLGGSDAVPPAYTSDTAIAQIKK
ncbi:hypothetical protein ONZ45_g15214 [Pleurotus djamor]|nr:hypothetical protein ONZ45_g15214 [Pleurotus djamor]